MSAGTVVIGAGLAGAHVLSTLREGGYDGPLTLIGNEGELPYERPPLSKAILAGAKEPSSAFVHHREWYDEHAITLHLGDAAIAIDRERREVALASGAVVPYTELVLATGASPRTLALPGGDLRGVHTLRTLADSIALRDAFKESSHLAVIGAGWIGLEAAATARQAGLDVTVLEYADVPLRAAMGKLGEHFAALHRAHGVDLRTGVTIEAIEGDNGRVIGVRAGGQTYPADLVLIGVGAAPNTDLAQAAGLTIDNGIVTDAQLRTNDPHIFAIGDVANAANGPLGSHVRVEHWDNAIRQGKLAGKVLLGGDDTYDWLPYFFTDQFDLGMEYVGRGGADDDLIIRGDQASGQFIAFWHRNVIVTAGMNVNIWDVNDDLRTLVGAPVDPARLADAAVGLTEVTN